MQLKRQQARNKQNVEPLHIRTKGYHVIKELRG